MTEDDFLEARDLLKNAMERAKEVLDYISNDEATAQLNILDDGRAVVTSWRASSGGYDGYELDSAEQFFPARLLFCPASEVDTWKEEEKKRQAAESQAWRLNRQREQEENERATLAALKAKYGNV